MKKPEISSRTKQMGGPIERSPGAHRVTHFENLGDVENPENLEHLHSVEKRSQLK